MLGTLEEGEGYRGGATSRLEMHCLEQDLKSFDMGEEKKEGRWKISAREPDERYGRLEKGMKWFMARWHRQEREASAKCHLERVKN